ncbi:arylsulfatase J-like [Mercenaria mercenaria]|uniref:arylsulfatase J-like n=1 Tax=Mercenaria mercenaria TaxID=6596 RepID=UPI00234E9FC3|nr:arylsulfatase J-like [Mercenaria mercenaria]
MARDQLLTKEQSAFMTKPHILLIVADDLGFYDVGYHGSRIKTPNIDRLAFSGVRLENYVQPICTPTRGQLLTGRYQIHTGLQWLLWPTTPYGLTLDNPTIADKLKEAGYATHMVGKWHLGFYKKEYLPTYRGFDSFFGFLNGHSDYYNHSVKYKGMNGYDLFENDHPANISKYTGSYSTTLFTEKVRDTIQNHNTEKPLFIYLSYQAVHSPLQVPKRYVDLNKNINKRMKIRRQYAGMVTCMDESVGNVVDAMKERGLWDNTLLIFTTDNGGNIERGASNWPLKGEKGCLYEGGIRAVGFVNCPLLGEQAAGSVSNELMHVTDWFPTLLNLAGGNVSGTNPLDGYDQWKTIKYGLQSPRKEILHDINPRVISPGKPLFNNTFNTTTRASLRMGDWKIITGYPDSGPIAPTNTSTGFHKILLMNIKIDPNEKTDLSERFPDITRHMLKRLEYYQSGMVNCHYPSGDPLANPSFRNGFWQPWK